MSGKRFALLLANANYQHVELRKLNAPHNDVQTLQDLLTRPEIGNYETELLIDGTKGQMERAINRVLTKGEREDTNLIFFAGHGIKHENGKLYFAAVDTEPEYLGGTAVSAAWLTEEMQNSKSGRQIILLDCCFGGAFARGNVWRGGDRIESGKALAVPDLEVEDRGQVVVASADAMQFAFEGQMLKGEPSASHFVRALKEGLETGDADSIPKDGKITIDELVSYLRKKMKELGSPQRPSKWTFGSVGGDLLFAYNPNSKVTIGSDELSTLPPDWNKQAQDYLEAKDYLKALPLFQTAAENGDMDGMYGLAWLYGNGLGVIQDRTQAKEWYQKAADLGHAVAMTSLGSLYENGLGVTKDYAKAGAWYQKAADLGDDIAMGNLGYLYENGLGVAEDYSKAGAWYQKAAELGDAPSMTSLGSLYENGLGVTKDYAKARAWYQKAANSRLGSR
jgi:Caspase domain/Sel1 repeat